MALLYIFVGIILPAVYCQDGPLVITPFGSIRGRFAASYNNKTYSSFRSIPYAQPPTGNLRFKDPAPLKSWNYELQANKTTICPQVIRGNYKGEEDCLYLNVFVSSTNPANIQEKLPVVIHIHGGSFMFGYGEDYTGVKFIMDDNMIYVTLNYRIGALGFMSTQDIHLPGNIGLKDQVAALKWVKANIHLFGGDPNQIGIAGFDAGAASVHYHYLSLMSKGLFKNGFSFSGTALSPWAFQEQPLEKARRLGRALNCSQISTKSMLDCMRTKPARLIAEKSHEILQVLQVWPEIPLSPFAPVVEPYNCDPKSIFLPEHPYDLMSKGSIQNLPWLTSFVQDQGAYPAVSFLNDNTTLPEINRRWEEYCPYLFEFQYTIPRQQQNNVCRNIRKEYFGNETISNSTYLKLVNAISDRLFILSTVKAAKLQAEKITAPVFVYKFNYKLERLPHLTVMYSTAPASGVVHGDDSSLILSLDHQGIISIPSENDRKMQNKILEFYFAMLLKNNPSIDGFQWRSVSRNARRPLDYMYMESPNLIEMRSSDNLGNPRFWNRIPFNENERFERN